MCARARARQDGDRVPGPRARKPAPALRDVESLERFPGQNPHPVLRLSPEGELLYANQAAAPVLSALGVKVGQRLPAEPLRLLRAALAGEQPEVEVSCPGRRTFSLLPVEVPDMGFINVYGTDVTARKVIDKFPDENPNPVLRVGEDGRLAYANAASKALTDALGLVVGERLPAEVWSELASGQTERPVEVRAGRSTYSLKAVRVPEFGFINVYGTDVTALKAIDKFPGQNPHPVLRVSSDGRLLYANPASAALVDGLGLAQGQALPDELRHQLLELVAAERLSPVEVSVGERVFELLPVAVREFDFINVYGTDVTAARQVAQAKEDTERLLLNILPPPIANRLRRGERVIADRFEDATLLIADIVGFTRLSSGLTADRLVELLNDIFSVCDALVERYRLEKVKTIGDAYMVVGGVPLAMPDHVERVADLGLELALAVQEMQRGLAHPVEVRIGMHCGPLVAGVIGSKRTIYDVWGDTVNVASRMESLGVAGRVQVTAAVYERLRTSHTFEPRGVIDVKGKGAMSTYFLTGRQ